jgi:hypothetical protein
MIGERRREMRMMSGERWRCKCRVISADCFTHDRLAQLATTGAVCEDHCRLSRPLTNGNERPEDRNFKPLFLKIVKVYRSRNIEVISLARQSPHTFNPSPKSPASTNCACLTVRSRLIAT